MRMATPVVAITIMVVTAGCGGALGGDTTPAGPESVHIAAPGINQSGVEDPDRLAAAHVSSLRNRSYTLHTVIAEKWPNGSTRSRIVSTLSVGPSHDRFHFTQVSTGSFSGFRPPPRLAAYSDGESTFIAIRGGNETAYSRYAMRLNIPVLTGQHAIYTYFYRLDDSRVREIRYDGWIAYRIDAVDRINASDTNDDLYITAVVDSFGLLHEFNATLPADYTGYGHILSGRVDYSLSYTHVGRTAVERPAWVAEARRSWNATTAAT